MFVLDNMDLDLDAVRHASQKKKLVAPVFLRAYTFKDKVAVIDQHGSHTYAKILYQAHNVSDKLLTVSCKLNFQTNSDWSHF